VRDVEVLARGANAGQYSISLRDQFLGQRAARGVEHAPLGK